MVGLSSSADLVASPTTQPIERLLSDCGVHVASRVVDKTC